MINTSTPSLSLTYYKTDTQSIPSAPLPDGYEFVFYRDGDEQAWAEIEVSVGQFSSIEEGIKTFRSEFLKNQTLLPYDRVLFVKSPDGELVATCSLWNGSFLGEVRQRLHWLAVKDTHAKKGIARALLCRLMQLYTELGYEGFLYLLTSSRYYPAIRIYRKLGFVEYLGPRSLSSRLTDEEFVAQAKQAKQIVDERLSASSS